MQNVILEIGEDRRKMAERLMNQLGDATVEKLKFAQTVLVKVNLVDYKSQLACTHVDTVRGVLDAIRFHSRAQVLIGDAGYYGTKNAFTSLGYENLPSEYENIALVDLNDDDFIEGKSVRRDGSHNTIRRSKIAHAADVKISVAPMKIHRDTAVSLSVKNWTLGTWIVPSRVSTTGRVWARWPWLNEEGPWAYHATVAQMYKDLPCDIGIVDGVLAMEGDGPVEGTAMRMNLMLASTDAVAADAVAATLMGIDTGDIGYLAMCQAQGTGIIDMGRINVPPMLIAEHARIFRRPRGFEENLRAWRAEDPTLKTLA